MITLKEDLASFVLGVLGMFVFFLLPFIPVLLVLCKSISIIVLSWPSLIFLSLGILLIWLAAWIMALLSY